jgi:hypothetical protein
MQRADLTRHFRAWQNTRGAMPFPCATTGAQENMIGSLAFSDFLKRV